MTIQQKKNNTGIALNASFFGADLNLSIFCFILEVPEIIKTRSYEDVKEAKEKLDKYLTEETDDTKDSDHKRIFPAFKRFISCLKGLKNEPDAQTKDAQTHINKIIKSLTEAFEVFTKELESHIAECEADIA